MFGIILALLIFLAVCFGVVAVVIQVAKTNDDPLKKTSVADQANKKTSSQFDWGKFLLSLGPIIAGFGVLGLIFQYWNDYTIAVKLTIGIVSLLIVDVAGLILFEFSQRYNSQIFSVTSRSLLILGSFLLGGVLFLIGQAMNVSSTNMDALIGMWFLGVLPFTFITRNIWQLGANLFIGLIFVLNYFVLAFNIAIDSGLEEHAKFNNWFYYLIFALFLIISVLIANWLSFYNTKSPENSSKLLLYGFNIFAFIALFFATLMANITESALSQIDSIFYHSYTLGLSTILSILILSLYFLFKDSKISVWWLPSLIITLALFSAMVPFTQIGMFTGVYLLQLPLLLWITKEYLLERVVINGILFYTITSIFYILWSVDDSLISSFFLLVGGILSLIMAIKHSSKQDYLIYTWVAVGLGTLIKILVLGLDASWVLLMAGLFLMFIGIYILKVKNK